MDLKGKTVLLTGVSKGIGAAISLQLVQKGAVVYGLGRSKPAVINPNLHFIKTDVRNYEDVLESFRNVLEHSNGRIDVLINNAGIGYFGALEEMDPQAWHLMLETNVTGIYNCTRFALQVMKPQKSGHIINISSTAGLEGYEQASAYCATKWAVRGLSQALYKELRPFGIKVTCVYPGSVKTDFFANTTIDPHDYMLMPEDVANVIINALETPANFHQVNVEIRPLQPKGPPKEVK